jgi:DNA-directed RNA polymerase subunit M/transcription elongation factor TFIIS
VVVVVVVVVVWRRGSRRRRCCVLKAAQSCQCAARRFLVRHAARCSSRLRHLPRLSSPPPPPTMSTSLSYCADCANLLYPRVDHANHVLLNACRNCPYYEEAQSNLVFRNDLMSVSKEQAGVTDGLAKDPTLRRTAELECPRCGRAE